MKISNDYLDDLLVRMAHHSTAIEGNTLTQDETKSILIDGYIPRAMNLRELNEVINYKGFMQFIRDNLEDLPPLSLELIKKIHFLLCQNAIDGVAGTFKTIPNMIIGASFTPTQPYMVITELQEWILNLEAQLEPPEKEGIIEAICRQHIAFERIHPFSDGNGRVGRALMVYICLQKGIAPIVVTKEDKAEYISYLNTEDVNGLTKFSLKLNADEEIRINLFSQI
ncbi:Fic family protein [Selenomonas ruminantium]|uniref:Fic family protein n=1 Tax=Selenomonas ruminantium TaxID=971 RepID=UPI0026F0837D|nr:Fic family protein [Selenomonas ruminantium]